MYTHTHTPCSKRNVLQTRARWRATRPLAGSVAHMAFVWTSLRDGAF